MSFFTIPRIRMKTVTSFRKLAIGAWKHPVDPSTYGEIDVEVDPILSYIDHYNDSHETHVTLLHFFVKAFADCLAHIPELNRVLMGNKLYHRKEHSIFVTTLLRGKHHADLSGFSILNPEELNLKELSDYCLNASKQLRRGTDRPIHRLRRLLNFLSEPLARRFIQFADFLMYSLNINLSFLGLPKDRFGSMVVSHVGVFGLKNASIPLFGFSRTPYAVSIGAIQKRLIKDTDASIKEERFVTITFTIDHRVIEGWHAGLFVRRLRKLCHDPTLVCNL